MKTSAAYGEGPVLVGNLHDTSAKRVLVLIRLVQVPDLDGRVDAFLVVLQNGKTKNKNKTLSRQRTYTNRHEHVALLELVQVRHGHAVRLERRQVELAIGDVDVPGRVAKDDLAATAADGANVHGLAHTRQSECVSLAGWLPAGPPVLTRARVTGRRLWHRSSA